MRTIGLHGRPVGLALAITSVAFGAMNGSQASAAIPGIERIEATSAYNSDDKSATATCSDGKFLLGGGGKIAGGMGEVLMDDMAPVDLANAFIVRGYEDQDGGEDYTRKWKVTAYAICSSALSGLERIEHTSFVTSLDKDVTAQCSTFDKLLLSSSGKINSAWGEVGMEQITPLAFLGTLVEAREEDPFSLGWSATAYAICANPTGLGAGAQVWDESETDTEDGKSATARCPDGQVLVGVGGRVVDTGGEVLMDDLIPSEDLTEVTVTAHAADAYADAWLVEAIGHCFTP